ncbi:MAG: hypothetical protein RR348_03725, partial [Clostridia bacterium]
TRFLMKSLHKKAIIVMKRNVIKALSLLFVIIQLFSLAGCVKNSENVEHTLQVGGGDIYASAKIVGQKVSSGKYLKGEKVEIQAVEFVDGYEFAYWYADKSVEIVKENDKYFVVMPDFDCMVLAKNQKNGEQRQKKQFRFELKVVNGGSPSLRYVNDYYNKGDKIPFGFRAVDSSYGDLTWSSSTGEKYDYDNFVMPNCDVTLTATYHKK